MMTTEELVLSKERARSCWTSLVQDNKERTIVLPKMTLQLYGVIRIGNNKKIIAKGYNNYPKQPYTYSNEREL